MFGIARNSPELSVDWSTRLVNESFAARHMLERAWSPETAYQGITLTPEDLQARGQCGVSALWLSRHLLRRGFDAYFTEGIIHLDGVADEHVWVEARRTDGPEQVIDITSDQRRTPNGCLVYTGDYNPGHGTIGQYEPQRHFAPYEVPRKKLLARFAILEANIARLPRRHRIKE